MTRLGWDQVGDRQFQVGVDRGVLYVGSDAGVPWNGLTAISEKPTGGATTAYYIDGVKYQNVPAPEEFEATLSAFTYPDEFAICDGSAEITNGFYIMHQPRKEFSLSYRSMVGNDVDGVDHAYKIHIIYNATAAPSQRDNNTLTESFNLTNFSWDITLRPPAISGYKPSGHVVIDSRLVSPSSLSAVEDIIYGSDAAPPRLPTPTEIFTAIDSFATFRVLDNGDGTYTVIAPDADSTDNGDGTMTFDYASVIDNGDGTFSMSTL